MSPHETNSDATTSLLSPRTATLSTRDNTNPNQQHHHDQEGWIGNTFSNTKNTSSLRIAFQNINGLGTNDYKNQIAILANEQSALDIDVLGITEHCLHTGHRDTLKHLHQTIRSNLYEKATIQINSSESSATQLYLPGGTALLTIGNTVGRIEPNGLGGDPMGRWSYVHLRRKRHAPVTIITIYQVNQNPTNTIGNTAWHQQRHALDSKGQHNTHPRTAFINDLIDFVQKLQSNHHEIIIGGDFNDTIHRRNSGILKLIMQTGLIDIWNHRYPNHPTFPTYARGTERIDTALCTTNLLNHIQTIGYSPYQWLTNSDHRALLIEFDLHKLYHDDTQSQPIQPISARHIRSNDHQRCRMFIDQFYSHLISNNAEAQLRNIIDNTADHNDVEIYDKLLGQAGDSAEKHCKRRRPEFYSVTIHQLRIKKTIVRCHLANLKHGRTDRTPTLQQRFDRANIDLPLPDSVEDTKTLLRSITHDLSIAAQQSYDIRENELKSRINQKFEPGTEQYQQRLRSIKKNEATRRAWQTMRFLKTGLSTHQSLNRIDIPETWPPPSVDQLTTELQDPKQCNAWKTITNPDDIDFYIRMRNRGHFGQAHGTPFTELPLANEVNWAANTTTAQDILLGHSQIETIDAIPQCQALLDACRAATQLNVLPPDITHEEFKGKLKHWRESTTTSPSGRHLGRYKALITKLDPKTEDHTDAASPTYKDKQTFIIQSIIAIINYCIQHEYTLNRWKSIINTMIFKEEGNYKIHRLRVIHIYEADFNLLLAVKWRQLLQHANLQGIINNGLFGGRPGCEAQSLVFLEELKYDTSYCSRRTLFNFDNDATSCYDRIIIALASIINRKYGLHQRIVALHANTLQQARFHLRTANGMSNESYSHCIRFPIYGSRQGSGNSPAIWLFISSTLCDVHNKISHGATFTNPQGTETVKLSMVAFVDDSTGTYNDFQPQSEPPIQTMLPHAQHDCQTWNDLLWCSGGKLELPKCSYHVLRFEFLPNGTAKPIKSCDDLLLVVRDAETGDQIQIPAKHADDPHKTLGHWKSPIQNRHSKQLTTLKTNALDISLLIGTGALTRHGADLAYHAIYCASLKFVLPQCFFHTQVLDQAEAKSLPIILAKQGFNRNTAKPIRFCPKSFAGCGMIPWKVLQGEGQLTLFLKHWRTNTIISKMLRMALAWTQWNAGTGTPILETPRTSLPYLEARWIASLRTSLTLADMHITTDITYTVKPERHGDKHLMDWILETGKYDNTQLRILNCCRLHLHVTTISELLDAHGRNFLPHMFNCSRPPWFNTRQYMPIQPRPSHHQIRTLWKPMCKGIKTQISTGQIRLHSWTGNSPSSRPFRNSYVDTTTNPPQYYHWINDSYWILKLYLKKSNDLFISDHATTWTPTNTALPTKITHERLTLQGTVYRIEPYIPVPTAALNTTTYQPVQSQDDFSTTTASLSPWQHTVLQGTKLYTTPGHIRTKQLQTIHPWIAYTDHHFLNDITCFSWLLFEQNGEILASGCGPCPGPPERTRADAWSILSIVQFLQHIWKYDKDDSRQAVQVVIINRNKRIVRRITDLLRHTHQFCNTTLDRDWDVISETVATVQSNQFERIQWEPMHTFLERHGSDNIQQLPILRQRLFDVKNIAKDSIRDIAVQPTHSPFLPSSQCMITHINSTIHGKYNKAYREAATLPELFHYLKKKHTWNDETHQTIHWKWFQNAVHRHHPFLRAGITKLVYNQLATQARKSVTGGGQWIEPTCPHCTNTIETFQHMIQCKHPTAVQFRKNLLQSITSTCHNRRAPDIIRTTLHSWFALWLNFESPDPTAIDPKLQPLYHAQAKIGWDLMIRGFFATEWLNLTSAFQPH